MADIQVNRETPPKAFVPVTLSLTFQTEEELQVFKIMCSYNLTIPDVVYAGDKTRNFTLSTLLSAVFKKLESYSKQP